jgi:salicylate hydroxylase
LLGYYFIHPRGENSAEGVSRPQNVEQMKSYFKGYAPVVQKALSYVEEAYVWRMLETMPPSWVSKSGKVVLTGDAAHAVLRFAGQVIRPHPHPMQRVTDNRAVAWQSKTP